MSEQQGGGDAAAAGVHGFRLLLHVAEKKGDAEFL